MLTMWMSVVIVVIIVIIIALYMGKRGIRDGRF